MSRAFDNLAKHLELLAHAYGPDLAVPPGTVILREPLPREPAAPDDRSPVVETDAAPVEPSAPDLAPIVAEPSPREKPAERAPAMAAATEDRTEQVTSALQALRDEVLPCTRCKLHEGRHTTVFGEGSPTARVMFIGEAPGAKEDRTGRPFVGPAGELLDRILKGAMGLHRQDVYIANVNKCRPPANRAPEADEVAACLPYLRRQVELIAPEVIVCLGRTAAQNLLGTTESTRAMRGREHSYAGIPVIVTWHPAYLLREPAHKRETWDDIKKVNRLLGLPDVPAS